MPPQREFGARLLAISRGGRTQCHSPELRIDSQLPTGERDKQSRTPTRAALFVSQDPLLGVGRIGTTRSIDLLIVRASDRSSTLALPLSICQRSCNRFRSRAALGHPPPILC